MNRLHLPGIPVNASEFIPIAIGDLLLGLIGEGLEEILRQAGRAARLAPFLFAANESKSSTCRPPFLSFLDVFISVHAPHYAEGVCHQGGQAMMADISLPNVPAAATYNPHSEGPI
jgi:hypothetical protein